MDTTPTCCVADITTARNLRCDRWTRTTDFWLHTSDLPLIYVTYLYYIMCFYYVIITLLHKGKMHLPMQIFYCTRFLLIVKVVNPISIPIQSALSFQQHLQFAGEVGLEPTLFQSIPSRVNSPSLKPYQLHSQYITRRW